MKKGAHVLKQAWQWWSLPWRAMGLLTLAFVLLPIGEGPAQAGGVNVDSLLTFTPLSATFRTLSDTTGCPATFVGKFTFTARLTNKADSPALPGLDVFVQTLSNGNLLLDPENNARLGGAGAVIPIPLVGEYADGLLSANEAVDVPFVVCLRTRESFQFFIDVFGVVTELVSVNQAGTSGGNFSSIAPVISANGGFVVFLSFASDLVATDTNNRVDVFVRDLQTGTTTLVSVNREETDSGNNVSGNAGGFAPPALISADGRYVAFDSDASDLVATDTNNRVDVFVRDLQTGTTTLVSVNREGTNSGNNESFLHALSADGRFVAFQSYASDLVANDTNGTADVFVRDLQTGTTTLVSVNRAGTGSGNRQSFDPVLSSDGRFVAFISDASDLVANDTNQTGDVFVRDLQTGTTILISVNREGTDSGNSNSSGPVLSSDGRFVAFESQASDLVATDTNGVRDVFVRDLQTGTTNLVSVNRAGTDSGHGEPNGISSDPVLSADGRFVAFRSLASDLVANDDTNGTVDVFVRDLQTGTTNLVSVNRPGTDSGNGQSFVPVLSADGRFVAFGSQASDLVATDTNGGVDVFVRDLQTGITTLASVNRAGTDSGNLNSTSPTLSADGRFVAFQSGANDLVATFTHGVGGVYVRPVP